MKIYVITSGEYSDYTIEGVTLDRKKAQCVAKLLDRSRKSVHIKEYNSDMFTGNEKIQWYISFTADGSYCATEMDFCADRLNRLPMVYKSKRGGYNVYIQADDKEHALKIAQDELARYKAEKEGIT